MGQTPRDNETEPSLELPSLPGFGRRKKSRKNRRTPEAQEPTREPEPQPAPEGPHDEPAEPTQALYAAPQEPSYNGTAALDEEAPRRRAERRRPEQAQKEPRKPRSTPLFPGPVAAILTGLLVGAAGAAGTYGAMTGCEVVRGVSSCGGAPGFLILVAIVALMVLLGTGLLRLLRVDDAASTSFLAVGLVAVVAMLVLLDVIFSSWMFVVIPVLSALAFLLARWVTSRFSGDTGRRDWT